MNKALKTSIAVIFQLITLTASITSIASGESAKSALLEDSRYWPFRVGLRTSFIRPDRPESPLPQGMRGVLIRVEDNELIVDFGRFGLYPVNPSDTDIFEQVKIIRENPSEKLDPNYVEMLGPRLIEHAATGPQKVPFSTVGAASAFLFIYIQNESSFEELRAQVEPFIEILKSPSIVPVLIPMYEYSNYPLLDSLDGYQLPFKIFQDFLCKPYAHSLHHEPGGKDCVVVTDMEGKILYRSAGLNIAQAIEAID